MTPYLVGALGLAGGIIAALWFRYKLAKLEGDHKLLDYKHDQLGLDHKHLADTSKRALERKDAEIEGLREREKEARKALRKYRAEAPVDLLVDDLNELFSVPKEG